MPEVVSGIPVKVIGGSFEFIQDGIDATSLRGGSISPNNPLGFDKDLVGGVPVAPPGLPDAFGTLGVVFSYGGPAFEGISCKHVLRDEGDRVDQRGPDISGAASTRPIGNVQEVGYGFHTPPTQKGESIDCALVKIDPSPIGGLPVSLPTPPGAWIREVNIGDGIAPVEMFFSKIRAKADMRGYELWKFGSSTGVRLTGRFGDLNIHEIRIGTDIFKNNFSVIETNSNPDFVLPGDSGSIIALRAKHTDDRDIFVAIGLLFAQIAGNNGVGLACNICHVIDKLNPAIPASRKLERNQWTKP